MLLPSLNAALSPADHQHGFRHHRSTVTALLPLVTTIANNIKHTAPHRRTAVVARDLKKAFDSVNLSLLIDEISKTNLNSNIVRWLRAYLRGRAAACVFRSARSSFRKIHFGVPQGSVLSPVLFNFFIRDFPQCAELTVGFADDLTILESDLEVDQIDERLNRDLEEISRWAKRKDLAISAEKSTVTFFTTDPHSYHHHPQVFLDGNLLKLQQTPTIRG